MSLLAGLLALAAVTPAPVVALTVPAEHHLIEGIASDGRTIWLSSVVDRQILVSRGARWQRPIAMPPDTARPLGLAYDAIRGWLWIATDCPKIAAPGDCAHAGLIAIDRQGRLKARFAPGLGEAHFGDVSVDRGVVHVADSSSGAVYRLRDLRTGLEQIVAPDTDRSAQGSAGDGHGGLIVADYVAGIAYVDPAGKRTLLPRPEGKPLQGVDGLVRVGNWYVGTRNPRQPGEVVAFRIAADRLHLTDLHVLASGDSFPEPTQIAVSGDRLLVVADAQWAAYDGGAKTPRPAQHMTPVIALQIPR